MTANKIKTLFGKNEISNSSDVSEGKKKRKEGVFSKFKDIGKKALPFFLLGALSLLSAGCGRELVESKKSSNTPYTLVEKDRAKDSSSSSGGGTSSSSGGSSSSTSSSGGSSGGSTSGGSTSGGSTSSSSGGSSSGGSSSGGSGQEYSLENTTTVEIGNSVRIGNCDPSYELTPYLTPYFEREGLEIKGIMLQMIVL